MFRVPSAGGSPVPLTTPTPEDAGNDHRWPQVLPGGRGVLFSVSTGPEDSARIVVLDARTGARKDLVTGSASARYVATGHLAYTRNGTLFVQPFDFGRLELTGSATRLADGVDEASNGEPGTGSRTRAPSCMGRAGRVAVAIGWRWSISRARAP